MKAGPTWSVPRLFMRTTPSTGEKSDLDHQLECIAHRGVTARVGGDRDAGKLPQFAQRAGDLLLAQRLRLFESLADMVELLAMPVGITLEAHARDLRLEHLHAQHSATGQRIVEAQLGPHVAVPFVERNDRIDHGACRVARYRLAELVAIG